MTDLSWLTARPIAHRGFHDQNRSRWENTLSALDAAAEKGFSIECDVHLSGDGVPMVFHDFEMQRLTGAAGHLWDFTAAELGALKIGASSDHVPTLAEMLERVAGRVPLVIELKGFPDRDEGLVAKVGAQLAAYSGKAVIMSFNHWLVRDFAAGAPGIPGGLTAMGIKPQELEAHFSMLAHNIAFASFMASELPNPFTTMLRDKLGLPIITWTVRDRATLDPTLAFADQMTFEGFDPDDAEAVSQLA